MGRLGGSCHCLMGTLRGFKSKMGEEELCLYAGRVCFVARNVKRTLSKSPGTTNNSDWRGANKQKDARETINHGPRRNKARTGLNLF